MGLGTHNANGFFYTSFNPDELNKKSFSNTIMRLFPNGSAPLYALTGETGKKRAVAATHGYFTKHMAYPNLTVDDADDLISTDTTLVVDSSAGVAAGMTFQVPTTREIFRIASVTDATTVVIERSFGRVAAGAIVDDEVCTLVGNAQVEASTRPVARSIDSAYVPNYTVIVRNAWAISDTAAKSLAEAGFNNVAENKLDCVELHSTEIEGQMLYGQAVAPATDTVTGKPIHATQGFVDAVYQHAAANVKTAGATTTYAQLVDLVSPAFAYSSSKSGGGVKERALFCDTLAMKVIHEIGVAAGQVTMTTETTSFGLVYTMFKFYRGILRLIEHPLLNELAPAAGVALTVDLPTLGVAYLEGRDVKREEYDGSKDSTGSGIDASGGSLTTEFATEFTSPNTCGIINGLTAGA